ncbi:MAG: adenylate/guanylate cyclase domain-containing protein [Mycobacterium sp.]
MDRIWQWAWDRYGARYWRAVFAVLLPLAMPIYFLWSFLIVAVQGSSRYLEATAVAVVVGSALLFMVTFSGSGPRRVVERWVAGEAVDRATALEATYAWTRVVVVRSEALNGVGYAVLSVLVGAVAGASFSLVVQYGILGAVMGVVVNLISVHSLPESVVRPARVAIAADMGVGESLPRSRPSFAAWSSVSMLAAIFAFAVVSAMLATVLHPVRELPVLFVVIGFAFTLGFGVPITVGAVFMPSLRPIRDLAEGTRRVAAGDYSQRLPVAQDDDLGALAASFNRLQAGLAERQRLQSAFGTYVDPALAARLLEQGDDVFTGERRQVSVMFVDIRDFTPFAEANTAEDTVARLNALFEIVVPAVVGAGGHVNKFLGDGALVVFGAPNDLADHADAALRAAVLIHRRVAERFGGELRIGIGINTGVVISGTIGGGGKLEFTLIGDAVNVAARVEQLTKTTGDTILLTQQCVNALTSRPPGLIDRGLHVLKGKAASVQIFGLAQETDTRMGLTR